MILRVEGALLAKAPFQSNMDVTIQIYFKIIVKVTFQIYQKKRSSCLVISLISFMLSFASKLYQYKNGRLDSMTGVGDVCSPKTVSFVTNFILFYCLLFSFQQPMHKIK